MSEAIKLCEESGHGLGGSGADKELGEETGCGV